MADLDEIALALPETVRSASDDGRPAYATNGRTFVSHREPRKDALDPETGERMDDVLVFHVPGAEVKGLLLADDRGIYFTTAHFRGYPAVLIRIPELVRLERDELYDLVVEAWLSRAQQRVAKAWLAEHEPGP
jgi:hypothetical protein